MLLPAGYAAEPNDRLGLASFTCEMVQRGCGTRNSRQFVEDLDRLGVDRSASVSGAHTSFGGSMLADNLPATLSIFADLVRAPHLPADQLEDGRQVCLQELWALEDDLAQKTIWRLKERHYGDPWGRSPHGTEEALEQITLKHIRQHVTRRVPSARRDLECRRKGRMGPTARYSRTAAGRLAGRWPRVWRSDDAPPRL